MEGIGVNPVRPFSAKTSEMRAHLACEIHEEIKASALSVFAELILEFASVPFYVITINIHW